MDDLYSEALGLAGGDVEKLAKEMVRQLAASREQLAVANGINEALRKMVMDLATANALLLQPKRGRPRKATGLRITPHLPKQRGRKKRLEEMLGPWGILGKALRRKEAQGGALIDHARTIVHEWVEYTGLQLTETEIERHAKNAVRKNSDFSPDTVATVMTDSRSWLSVSAGYPPPK